MNDTPTNGRTELAEMPLIPVRMLNEYVYCPRLAYMMWVQGEFAHSADTVEGTIRHKRVDKASGTLPVITDDEPEQIHARSVYLSSEKLGLTSKVDLVEGEANCVQPVDYKKGKRPHVEFGAYEPERVQVCAQGLLLREHGFQSDYGYLYFIGSRERVKVVFDEDLISRTVSATAAFLSDSQHNKPPPPLLDSPKCPRCSLVGICLPDELGFLTHGADEIRAIYPRAQDALPLYIQTQGSYIKKDGGQLIIEEKKQRVAEARIMDTSQVVLFGHAGISTPALHECFRQNIPVTFMSYGGWFVGHCVGTGHKNVLTRTMQYQTSFDGQKCLRLARKLISAKIHNCRTLMRRNWKGASDNAVKAPPMLLTQMKNDVAQCARVPAMQTLLGVEGNAARHYFEYFPEMILPEKREMVGGFDFTGRNRRPPKDPVNAMLSFAYAMLAREWTVTLSAVGLDPYRGFYHQMRFGRPALALDMMEPFRPLVADSTVITVINNGEIKPEDFIVSAVGCNLKPGGRKSFIAAFERRMAQEVTHPIFKYRISYRRLFEVQARLLIRYLAGEIPRYPNFVTR
ncbi:MAG: CRISPR-associated endonuclease Cas1 [Desulfobacterales bacterium]|jgi:CRISPR-associated protein Cas1|nr:CRISPR-associated endonuclease Cas1 [Desulfobacterales bacterium]